MSKATIRSPESFSSLLYKNVFVFFISNIKFVIRV